MSKIVLDGDLVLKTVEAMKAQLLSSAEHLNASEIALRNVSRWDVTGIQLLYAFKKYYASHDKAIVFTCENTGDVASCQEMLALLNNHK